MAKMMATFTAYVYNVKFRRRGVDVAYCISKTPTLSIIDFTSYCQQ